MLGLACRVTYRGFADFEFTDRFATRAMAEPVEVPKSVWELIVEAAPASEHPEVCHMRMCACELRNNPLPPHPSAC